MVVINVGGHKTGSTWVQNILRVLLRDRSSIPPATAIPEELAVKIIPGDKAAKVWDAINGPAQTQFLIKIHFHEESGCLLPKFVKPHIKFVHVVRDPRDAFVSMYYHDLGVGRRDGGFAEYFDERAKRYLRAMKNYNRYWERMTKFLPNQVHTIRYEQMKRDYAKEMERLISFLEIDAAPEDVEHLYSLNKNKDFGTAKWMKGFRDNGQKFYRKGEVGDHRNHFTMMQQIRFVWHNTVL